VEKSFLAVEDPGHEAAHNRGKGYAEPEEEYDLDDFSRFHSTSCVPGLGASIAPSGLARELSSARIPLIIRQ
jgi:hypothetical protein